MSKTRSNVNLCIPGPSSGLFGFFIPIVLVSTKSTQTLPPIAFSLEFSGLTLQITLTLPEPELELDTGIELDVVVVFDDVGEGIIVGEFWIWRLFVVDVGTSRSSLGGGLGLTFLMAKAGVAIGFLTAAVLICKAEGGR